MTREGAVPSPSGRLGIGWAAWLGATLAVVVGLGTQGADHPTPFAVAHAYRAVVWAELAFILALVPLFSARPRGAGLADVVALLALGGPAVAVGAWVSDASLGQVAASQGYVVVAGAAVAGYLGADAGGRLRGWYWLTLGAAGAGGPFVAFIAEDLLGARVGWLRAVSPFWVADSLCVMERLAWRLVLPWAGLAVLAAVLLALRARSELRAGRQAAGHV